MLFIAAAPAPAIYYVPPVNGAVIRHFEPPPDRYSAGHRGLDLAARVGTTVVASAAGHVAFAGKIAGKWYVSIDDAGGIRTTYDYLDAVLVKKGQDLNQRDPVGVSGKGHPGSTEAAHMMFGMKRGSDYLDPEPYLVGGFRHDFSSYVRLSDSSPHSRDGGGPSPLPSSLALPIWTQPALPPNPRTQPSRRALKRSLFGSGAGASSARTGICRARPDGPRARSPATPR